MDRTEFFSDLESRDCRKGIHVSLMIDNQEPMFGVEDTLDFTHGFVNQRSNTTKVVADPVSSSKL